MPVTYEVLTKDEYSDAAAASFEVRSSTGGVVLLGGCPRCADPMEFPWVDDSYRGSQTIATPTDASTRIIPMVCTCTGTHEGRPEDGVGCGAYWALKAQD